MQLWTQHACHCVARTNKHGRLSCEEVHGSFSLSAQRCGRCSYKWKNSSAACVHGMAETCNAVIFQWYIAKTRSFNDILLNMQSFDGARAVWNSTDRIVEGDVVFGLINTKYNRPASLLVFR
jgi:hypothetical protein